MKVVLSDLLPVKRESAEKYPPPRGTWPPLSPRPPARVHSGSCHLPSEHGSLAPPPARPQCCRSALAPLCGLHTFDACVSSVPMRLSQGSSQASRSTFSVQPHAVRAARRPVPQGRGVGGRQSRSPALRGAAPTPCPRDGGPPLPQGALHRAERPRGHQRRTGGVRPGPAVGCPLADGERPAPARRRLRQHDASRRTWLLLARNVRRIDADRDPLREDGHRPVQQVDAAHARRQLRPHQRDRPGGRGRPAAHVYTPGEIGEVERRIGEFVADLVPDGATLQMGIGAIPTAVGSCLRGQEAPRGSHRDVHGPFGGAG